MEQQQAISIPASEGPTTTSSPAPAKPKRRFWIVILLVAVLLLLGVIHHRRKMKKETAEAAVATASGPVSVTSAQANTGDIGVYLSAIGTVTPVYTDSVTSQVTGVIQSVHYREGQLVHQGDALIDIDPQPYAAQLGEANGVLERDENLLAQAQMDLERYRQAWSRNGISRQQLEDQEKVVLEDQGTVHYDKSAIQYAQVQLNYCHIVSPITGRVGIRLVDPGNLVTANATTALVVITQLRPITVIFTLAEDSLSQVLGQMSRQRPLTVEVYDRGQDKLIAVGKLSTVDNQIDTTTGTVKLRASFDNSKGQLFPNQFVNTRLLVTTLHDQVLIPSSAIQHNGDTAFVYLLQGGKAMARTIKPGGSDKGQTAVQGVQPGDVIANSSFEKLQNGAAVTISNVALPTGNSNSNGDVAP